MIKYDKEYEKTRMTLISRTIDLYDYAERIAIQSTDVDVNDIGDPVDYVTNMMSEMIKTPEIKEYLRAYTAWATLIAEKALEG